ncbi:MAG: CheR family methyltransferase [Pseudomonadota bacterium]
MTDDTSDQTADANLSDVAGDVNGMRGEDTESAPAERVRIVGIGASAGGLEPIEQFFDAVATDTGLAYVIVQHLSPDFRSMMPELLERHSDLVIRNIVDGMAVEPNKIYLSPPRSSVEIKSGRLYVYERKDAYEFSLPINDFFESLASEFGRDAICIVLSGTGSDGTLGAETVARVGGLVMAQDPSTSKFESMPRSVVEVIPQTIYAPATKLPELITRALSGEVIQRVDAEAPTRLNEPEREIVRMLQHRYGLDFGYYKTTTVGRRIGRRAKLTGINDLAEYSVALSRNPEELESLYADLLIGVTAFFRDRQAFDLLKTKVLPKFDQKLLENEEIRIWVPGCASGEEAYSIAILLHERARLLGADVRLRIFGTDIHPRSLKQASRAIYSASSLERVPPDIRESYFTQQRDEYQLNKEIRELVVFSKHNLIKDPPFTRMDLVACRNLLIYFDEQAQRKVIAMFHFALRQGGVLFLGPSETLGDLNEEFDAIDPRWHMFTKRRDVRLVEATRLLPLSSRETSPPPPIAPSKIEAPADQTHFTTPQGMQRHSLMRIYDAVLARVVGTSLLVSHTGEVMHVFGDAGKFLAFRQGQFSQKIGDLVDDQLKLTFNTAIDRLQKSADGEFVRKVEFVTADDEHLSVYVKASVLDTGGPVGSAPILVSITAEPSRREDDAPQAVVDIKDETLLRKQVDELERSLRFSEETLQTTVEELETSNEELQATNEELQATNEELMAANEELQTVNEELHAVNEELFTVSSEHQSKIGELTSLTNDLDNLLQSTNIGVLFLDAEKNIRRITPAVSRTFNILARDIGRPIQHVTSRFEFPDFDDLLNQVLESGTTLERNIEVEGRDYLLRILPYKRNDKIDGAVLTFVDISDIARLNRSLSQFADIVSHDLKAPIRAIRTTTDWIVEDLGEAVDQEIQQHTKRLMDQTDRLAQMLSDLRDFSNFTQPDQRSEIVDVKAMVTDIAEFFGDDVKLEFTTQLPELDTTKTALHMVFQNIIDNAVKHGDKKPTLISISAREQDKAWVFAVTDDGPGIDPRHKDKIFLPFRKLKPIDQSAGSGIGLALVRKAVEDRGGTIEVHSAPEKGRGASFVFTWPD